MQLARGALVGRNGNAAAASLAAGILCFLEGRPGIVALARGRFLTLTSKTRCLKAIRVKAAMASG
jgi:hypothetical protein